MLLIFNDTEFRRLLSRAELSHMKVKYAGSMYFEKKKNISRRPNFVYRIFILTWCRKIWIALLRKIGTISIGPQSFQVQVEKGFYCLHAFKIDFRSFTNVSSSCLLRSIHESSYSTWGINRLLQRCSFDRYVQFIFSSINYNNLPSLLSFNFLLFVVIHAFLSFALSNENKPTFLSISCHVFIISKELLAN